MVEEPELLSLMPPLPLVGTPAVVLPVMPPLPLLLLPAVLPDEVPLAEVVPLSPQATRTPVSANE
jgi:hypothetical protein